VLIIDYDFVERDMSRGEAEDTDKFVVLSLLFDGSHPCFNLF